MGVGLSWLAVKGSPPEAIRDELGFSLTGERWPSFEEGFSAVEMPNGWYLIIADHNRCEQVAQDSKMRQLSEAGCELVTCFVEEHVMFSRATGWKGGCQTWSITHDSDKGLRDLEVKGEPPDAFAAIREEKFANQSSDDGECDHVFDIPVETAASVTGYRYDQDVPGMSGDVFEVLVETKKGPRNSEKSFFRKLFGR